MAIRAHTTVFNKQRSDSRGGMIKSAITYSFASVAQNDFTYPISLAGAKSVWVSNATAKEAAEFYLPVYDGGEIDIDAEPPTQNQMSASFVQSSEDAGVGMDVVVPSTAGAGFIGGSCMPPALTVKHKGSTASTILIHITY